MPMQWTISHPTRLVIAVAKDDLVLKDIEDYLDAIVAAGALSYRKIFDTTGASVHLSEDDLMALGARIRAYIALGRIGPLAIVATTDNSYGQARMFTTLADADRPVRIFRDASSRLQMARRARRRRLTRSDVAEVAAAALAGGEAGGAGARLGLQRRHAASCFVDQRLGDLEAPLLVGRAAVGAQAGLRELARAARPAPSPRPAPGLAGTSRLARPQSKASRAPTSRPVRIMSRARLWPIRRGRRTVPPSIRGTPQRRQNTPNLALSDATRMSHHSASSRPPATA